MVSRFDRALDEVDRICHDKSSHSTSSLTCLGENVTHSPCYLSIYSQSQLVELSIYLLTVPACPPQGHFDVEMRASVAASLPSCLGSHVYQLHKPHPPTLPQPALLQQVTSGPSPACALTAASLTSCSCALTRAPAARRLTPCATRRGRRSVSWCTPLR